MFLGSVVEVNATEKDSVEIIGVLTTRPEKSATKDHIVQAGMIR
jgi:hypothetical protein